MSEFNRRGFLAGAITLLAVTTFKPTISMGSNLPRIFADGRNYDSEGFQALFDNREVIFADENIGVNACEGVIIHKGNFVIDREIYIPFGKKLVLQSGKFDGRPLPDDEAFFSMAFTNPESGSEALAKNLSGVYLRSSGKMLIRSRVGGFDTHFGLNRVEYETVQSKERRRYG